MDLQRLALLLGVDVRHAEIPHPVAVLDGVVYVRDPADRPALARGLALVLLSRGGADHTTDDVAQLASALATR
jgi:hypothetical protein